MTHHEPDLDAGLPSRLLASSLFALGEIAVLSILGVEPGLILAWALISAGIVAVLERDLAALLLPALFAKKDAKSQEKAVVVKYDPEKASSKDQETQEDTSPDSEPDSPSKPPDNASPGPAASGTAYTVRLTLELVLPLLLAILTFLGSGRLVASTQTKNKTCAPCCALPCGQNGGQTDPQHETTLRIRPSLEQALERYFSRNDPGSSQSPLNTLLLLAIAVGIAFVAFSVRKHPSTAAPLSAAGIAVAAMKSDHLSHLDKLGSYVFLGGFIAVIAVIFLSTLRCFRVKVLGWQPARDTGKGGSRGKMVESPLNTMVSLAILLWTGLALCFYQKEKKVTTPPPPPPPPTSGRLEYRRLEPIRGFRPFSSALPVTGDPIAALAKEIGSQQNARLLLLGSADCTAIRRSSGITNAKLAEDRAKTVKTALQELRLPGDLTISADSLHQHDRCRESSDLRAVFPVLIQPAANHP